MIRPIIALTLCMVFAIIALWLSLVGTPSTTNDGWLLITILLFGVAALGASLYLYSVKKRSWPFGISVVFDLLALFAIVDVLMRTFGIPRFWIG